LVLRLAERLGAGADAGPDAGDRAMLAEAGLVLVIDQDALVGVLLLDLL
jgi:hypothetical protein